MMLERRVPRIEGQLSPHGVELRFPFLKISQDKLVVPPITPHPERNEQQTGRQAQRGHAAVELLEHDSILPRRAPPASLRLPLRCAKPYGHSHHEQDDDSRWFGNSGMRTGTATVDSHS